jgi:WD40 repeat protein
MSTFTKCNFPLFAVLVSLAWPGAAGCHDTPASPPTPRADAHGDPLPPGAIARLGTPRFWAGGMISTMAVSPDGEFLAADAFNVNDPRYADGKLLIWNADSGKLFRAMKGYGLPTVPICLAFSPNSRSLAVADTGSIWLVQLYGGTRKRILADHHADVHLIRFSGDGKTILTAGEKTHSVSKKTLNQVQVWDLRSEKLLKTWESPVPRLSADGNWTEEWHLLAISPKGEALAWGLVKVPNTEGETDQPIRTIKISDALPTGRPDVLLEPPAGLFRSDAGYPPHRVVLSADNRFLAYTSTKAKTLHVWDIAAKKEIFTSPPRTGLFLALALSPEGKTLASIQSDGVHFWDVVAGKELQRVDPGFSKYGPAVLLPLWLAAPPPFFRDSRTLVLAWGKQIHTLHVGKQIGEVFLQPADYLGFSADGKQLISLSSLERSVWDTQNGKRIQTTVGLPNWDHFFGKSLLPLDPDLSFSLADRNFLEVRSVAEGKVLIRVPMNRPDKMRWWRTVLSPDKKQLAVLFARESETTIESYQLTDGKMDFSHTVRFGSDSKDSGPAVAYAHQNPWLALPHPASRSALTIVDLKTGKELQVLDSKEIPNAPEHQAFAKFNRVRDAHFTPDDQHLVGVVELSGERKITLCLCLWKKNTGKLLWHFSLPRVDEYEPDVYKTVVSPDGRLLALVRHGDPAVHLLEVATGKERVRYSGHETGFQTLAFSPDCRTLASGSTDASILLWDLYQLAPDAPAQNTRLTDATFTRHWQALSDLNPAAADPAIRALTHGGKDTLPFLKKTLPPATGPDPKQVQQWITDLASLKYQVRTKAMQELEKLGDSARPALQQALKGKNTLEVIQRLELVLNKVENIPLSPTRLQQLRALEVLERIGTPPARELLQALARGAPDDRLTEEAKMSLKRLP